MEELVDTDVGIQFLHDFAAESLGGCLARFNLAPWPFPEILPGAVAPLGGKDLVAFADDGCYYFYGFHSDCLKAQTYM